MKKIEITEKQAAQFNSMVDVLNKISKSYYTPTQLRKNSEKVFGLEFEECIEMTYENIQTDALCCVKGIKKINLIS